MFGGAGDREAGGFVGWEGQIGPIPKRPAMAIIEPLWSSSPDKYGVFPLEDEQRAVSSVG